MTKIYVGYNEKFIFDALAIIYSDVKDVQVIGGVENDKLLENILDLNFDILLLELGKVRNKELDFINKVRLITPNISLLLLTSKIPPHTVSSLIKHQPDGFLLKSCSKNDLIHATLKIIDGNKYFCPKITQLLYADMIEEKNHENHKLTHREQEILIKIVNGETNYNIATAFNISETTVKTHRKNIMHKLGTTNCFALVRYACRENLIQRNYNKFCNNCPCT